MFIHRTFQKLTGIIVVSMVEIEKIMGRMGNKMFMFATLYSLARNKGTDFYFQDPKWFKKYEGEIKAIYGEGINPIPYVSIHVRRGDYLTNNFHTVLTDTGYYEKAIKLFPSKSFLIFSDDPEWCKINFTGKEFQIIEGQNEVDDLNMMAGCEHNIIANSSFSWWAAYLNKNPNKRVISPREVDWYKDGYVRTKVPKEWTQLAYE